jgi:hypothetical protein
MKYLLLVLLLVGCQKPGEYVDWKCLKHSTSVVPSVGTNGQVSVGTVTTCSLARCALYQVTDSGKWYIPNGVTVKQLLPDEQCL